MADLFHIWGSDLIVDASGKIEMATEDETGMQRVLRRLSTNVGDYIFALDYGAGLPGRIGGTDTPDDLRAVILQQMTLEPKVSSNPVPTVVVQTAAVGERQISITYVSASSGDTVALEL